MMVAGQNLMLFGVPGARGRRDWSAFCAATVRLRRVRDRGARDAAVISGRRRSRSPRFRATRWCCSRFSCGARRSSRVDGSRSPRSRRWRSCSGSSPPSSRRGGSWHRPDPSTGAVDRRARDACLARAAGSGPASGLATSVRGARQRGRGPCRDGRGDRLLPRHMADGRDRPSVARLRSRCAEVLCDALPAAARDAVHAGGRCTEVLLDSLVFRAYDDARGLLLAARAAGVRVVVASNWDAGSPTRWRASGCWVAGRRRDLGRCGSPRNRRRRFFVRRSRWRARRRTTRSTSATTLRRTSSARGRSGSRRCCSHAAGRVRSRTF